MAAGTLVVIAFAVLILGSSVLREGDSTTTTGLPRVEGEATLATVDAFVAAFNAFDREAFVGWLDSDPTVLQWPSSVRPYEVPLTDLGWFEFEEELEGRLTLTGCKARPPSPSGSELYDAIVDCDATFTNRLFIALDGGAMSGQIDFGVSEEKIESVFWNETDLSATRAVTDLRFWMIEHQPHLAAHWFGGSTGTPLYGSELADVLLNAADERSRSGGGPPFRTRPIAFLHRRVDIR